MADGRPRCEWAVGPERMIAYHDHEWGVPVHDDRLFFEFLILEGAQAGLSWSTVLQKREAYRQAFDDFNPKLVASYADSEITQLRGNPGIIRNRLKLQAAVTNAQVFLEVVGEYDSFDNYIWQFTDGHTIQNRWRHVTDVPTVTKESETMSRDLKRRGFRFVGPTICYAFMQAVGIVNDHTIDCFRHAELAKHSE